MAKITPEKRREYRAREAEARKKRIAIDPEYAAKWQAAQKAKSKAKSQASRKRKKDERTEVTEQETFAKHRDFITSGIELALPKSPRLITPSQTVTGPDQKLVIAENKIIKKERSEYLAALKSLVDAGASDRDLGTSILARHKMLPQKETTLMSKSLDTFRPDLLAANAAQVAKDFKSVAVYYFNHSKFKRPLTHAEAVTLSKSGLYIVSVWENGSPTVAGYFSAVQGLQDAQDAHRCACAVGQPAGTVVYLAVDYDAAEADLTRIVAYFEAARDTLIEEAHNLGQHYTVGVYGSGLVCAKLSELGIVSHTWLSESRGFSGFEDWLPHADIVQSPSGPYLGIDIDADETGVHGGGGWKVLS